MKRIITLLLSKKKNNCHTLMDQRKLLLKLYYFEITVVFENTKAYPQVYFNIKLPIE